MTLNKHPACINTGPYAADMHNSHPEDHGGHMLVSVAFAASYSGRSHYPTHMVLSR